MTFFNMSFTFPLYLFRSLAAICPTWPCLLSQLMIVFQRSSNGLANASSSSFIVSTSICPPLMILMISALIFFNESNQFLSFSFQDFLQHIFNFSFVFVEKFSNDHSCVSFGVQPINKLLPQIIENVCEHFFIVVGH